MLHADLLYLLTTRVVERVHVTVNSIQVYILVKISFEILHCRNFAFWLAYAGYRQKFQSLITECVKAHCVVYRLQDQPYTVLPDVDNRLKQFFSMLPFFFLATTLKIYDCLTSVSRDEVRSFLFHSSQIFFRFRRTERFNQFIVASYLINDLYAE